MKPYEVKNESCVISLMHQELYDSSLFHFTKWSELSRKSVSVFSSGHQNATPEQLTLSFTYGKEAKAHLRAMISLGAFSLEGFINFYAEWNQLEKRREKESKLGTKKKWRSYPNLIGGRNLDCEALRRIDLIFNLRDNLAHPKPHFGECNPSSFFLEQNAAFFLNTIHIAARELDSLKAPHPSADWIQEDFVGEVEWQSDVWI